MFGFQFTVPPTSKFWLPPAATALGWILLSSHPIAAQITPDEGLNSTVTFSDQNKTIQINGGSQPDDEANLFHGFREFSVLNGYTAHFNNAPEIQNIFSRVSGSNPSIIDGIIKANGTANLFLINPNGIIFGADASLDIGGSFLATTADRIIFEDGSEFNARDTQGQPLLTVSVPIGLQWRSQARDINVQQSILEVDPGRTLSLFGGNINLVGDIASDEQGQLIAPGGRIELGGILSPGIIQLNRDGSSRPNDATRADVSLNNGMVVDVQSDNGGNIAIKARNLNLAQGSILIAGIAEGEGSPSSQAGDIEIDATDIVTLDGSSLIANTVDLEALGNGGNININTGALYVTDGAGLNTNLAGTGNAGDVNIKARDIVVFDGATTEGFPTTISSIVGLQGFNPSKGQGNSGNININSGSLIVKNGAAIGSSTVGVGDAGDVNISARDTVVFDGVGTNGFPSSVSSTVGLIFPQSLQGVGNGGDIKINARSLFVTNGAFLAASSISGEGEAGNIKINARDTVVFDGVSSNGIPSAVISTLGQGIRGKAGGIEINTRSLFVTDGAVLSTFTAGQGKAGNIQINATSLVELSGLNIEEVANGFSANSVLVERLIAIFGFNPVGISTGLYTSSELGAQGEGGDITVTTPSFRLTDGAIVNAQTRNTDRGGNITINTDRFEAINGGQVITTTGGSGNAGTIDITASDRILLFGSDPTFPLRINRFGSETVRNQGSSSGLFASSEEGSRGRGGDIQLQANRLFLDNGAFISAETASSQGGNIAIELQDLLLLAGNSQISTRAGTPGAGGNGGNVMIKAKFIVASPKEDNDITANAFEGQGGQIDIDTQGIFGLQQREAIAGNRTNDIDASSRLGIDGTVNITNPEVDPTAGAIELTSTPVNVDTLIAQDVCKIEGGKIAGGSSFVVTGRGGLPPTSEDPLINSYRIVEWATRSPSSSNNNAVILRDRPNSLPSSRPTTAIEQARGWKLASDGTLMLTAQPPSPMPLSPSLNNPQCQRKS